MSLEVRKRAGLSVTWVKRQERGREFLLHEFRGEKEASTFSNMSLAVRERAGLSVT